MGFRGCWSVSLGSRPAFLPSRPCFRACVLAAMFLSTETFLHAHGCRNTRDCSAHLRWGQWLPVLSLTIGTDMWGRGLRCVWGTFAKRSVVCRAWFMLGASLPDSGCRGWSAIYGCDNNSCGCNWWWPEVRPGSFRADLGPVWGPKPAP